MGHDGQFVDGHAFGQGGDDFVDEFAAHRADALAADDFAGHGVGEQFHEAVQGVHHDGFAVVVEGIARGQKGNAAGRRRFFREAAKGDLRLGEHDGHDEAVIHAGGMGTDDVAPGGFALLHGDVDNLIKAGAVAGGVNVRRAGLHGFIGDDVSVWAGFDAGLFQIQRSGVGDSAQGEQQFPGGNGNGFAVVLEGNGFEFSLSFGVQQFCAGKDADAFAAENIFNNGGSVGVEVVQDVRAALDESDADAEPGEELREFAGGGAAAEDDEGFGKFFEVQGAVAVQAIKLVQPAERGGSDRGTGGDDELPGGNGEGFAGGKRFQFQRVGIEESGIGADEFEFAGVKLPDAIAGEVPDERAFARHDFFEIERDFRGADAEGRGVPDDVRDFGHVKEGLGGHAAAKGAKAADFPAAFNDDGFEAGGGGGPGGGESATASANDGHVIIAGYFHITGSESGFHCREMGIARHD